MYSKDTRSPNYRRLVEHLTHTGTTQETNQQLAAAIGCTTRTIAYGLRLLRETEKIEVSYNSAPGGRLIRSITWAEK